MLYQRKITEEKIKTKYKEKIIELLPEKIELSNENGEIKIENDGIKCDYNGYKLNVLEDIIEMG